MANDIQSPNSDQLERAAAALVTGLPPDDPRLSEEHVADLFQRCIKLASENKINQKNSWELKLIDHLFEIIKVEGGNDSETNFQKASCTLEAGVKIYSVRVDSVHAEAYKVLGRINRAGGVDEQESTTNVANFKDTQDKSRCKKEPERKISPLSTLESSFEALNLKKFDVAFVVDPLYHQTSAQFDEGGARGLLLNNLGVYGGCQVLFDSSEVPRKCRSCLLHNNGLDLIDLSSEKETIEQMVMNMLAENDISPTLNEILCHIGEDNQRPAQASDISQSPDIFTDAFDDYEAGLDVSSGRFDTAIHDDDDINVSHEDANFGGKFQNHQEDYNSHTSVEADIDDRSHKVSAFLLQGLAIASKKNAWAGPDHWKFWRARGSEDGPATPSRPTDKRSKNHTEVDLVFTTSIEKEFPDIFCASKSLKSLLLPANRVPSSTLPEDCHYSPYGLVKLFLLPNVLVFGKRRPSHTDGNSWAQSNNLDEALPSWDNESVAGQQYNGGYAHNSVEDLDTLVSQPRQVTRIKVQYDRTSKRVDLHALKNTLWDHMQEFVKYPAMELKNTISFKSLLSTFPANCQAAMPEDVSPHLCFICLLHLANEHGLSILDCATLDDLGINLPSHMNSCDGAVKP